MESIKYNEIEVKIDYENNTIWFKGSYYMESYYKTEIINNTNYTVYLNGEVYTPSTTLEFNYEQTPILYIVFRGVLNAD